MFKNISQLQLVLAITIFQLIRSLKLIKDVNNLYYFSDGQTFQWCEQYQQNVQFLLPDGWYKEKNGIDTSLGMYCIFDNSQYNILSEYQIILNRQSDALDFSQTETVLQNFYGNKNQFYMGNDYIFNKCNQSQQCELIIMMETMQTQQKLDIQIEDFFFQQSNSRYQFKGQQICSNTITDYSCVSDWNDNYFYAQSSTASAYDTCQIPGFYNASMCSKANLFGKYNYLANNQQQSMAFFNVLGDNAYTDISKLIIGIRKYNTREVCTLNQVSNCRLSQNSSACQICETGYYREYNGQCISCASTYNTFCTVCNQNQCIQCMGDRSAPYCYCSKGNVPDTNNQCNSCQNGEYFNFSLFNTIVSDGSININDYKSQVCQTCKNYNQYCTSCNEQQCLECQGSRIAPDCFCHSQYVPDINNNCNLCPQDTYFDQTLFLNIIQDGTINLNDYESQVCLSCQNYNIFCTQCDSTTCLSCQGDRIAPDCFCSLNYVPEISNNINCVECQDGSFYNAALYLQKVQDGSLNIQDYQSQVCQLCTTTYNNFCTQCDNQTCLQCQGERIAPDCYCQFSLVPDINNNCNECQSDQFFNHTEFENLISNFQIDLANYESQVCQSCQLYNNFCQECDENQCIQCQGERQAPDCFCPLYYVPDLNNNCIECLQGSLFNQTEFNNIVENGLINIENYQSQVCVQCQNYNIYCINCDENQCLECQGDRIAPQCYCSKGNVPDTNNQCNSCQNGEYFNFSIFNAIISDGSININDYESQVCQTCKNHNQYCTSCNEQQCLECQGSRIAPDCFCHSQYVPDINNNCNLCPQDTYFDQTLFLNIIQDGTINLNDYESQVCLSCQNYNTFCTQCDSITCLSCQGDRIAPDCFCSLNYVPENSNNINCVECQDGSFYNAASYLQKVQDGSLNIQDYQSQVCQLCTTTYNNFCTQCDDETCLQCQGERIAPDCYCQFSLVPDINNNCNQCPQGNYFDHTLFQDLIQVGSLNINDYGSQVCLSCQNYNSFCTKCDTNTCLSCQGDRIAPDCYCSLNYVPDINNNCVECQDGYFFNSTQFQNIIINDSISINDYKSQVCISCQNYNNFCTICDLDSCISCEGDRMSPNCLCPLNQVPDENNNCVECQENSFFNSTLFQEKIQDNSINLDDYQSQVCQQCTIYNDFCTLCDEDGCLQCAGDRVAPDCYCSINLIPGQNNECIECNGQFFNNTKYNELLQSGQLVINDYESQVCVSCQIFNQFCDQCDSSQCFLCQGDRIAPDCYCQQGFVPDINNNCNQCQNGYFFNFTAFDEVSNLADYENEVCQQCSNYNQFCLKCDQNSCLSCQGDRITPNCFCSLYFVPDENNNCMECQNGYFFNSTLFQEKILDNSININDYESQICKTCKNYNDFCTQCDDNTCLTCEGDRVTPGCYCPLNFIPDINNKCIKCQEFQFFNQTKFQEIILDSSINLQDYESQVCQLCTTTYNNFCTQCDDETCLQCQGERIAPDCYCQFSHVPDINNNCNECPQGNYFDHTLFQDLIQVGSLNINDYGSQVCLSCQNYNSFCTKCDTNTCLSCQGDRIAPDCYCSLNYVPDINNNCIECQEDKFFNNTKFNELKLANTINIQDYESQICQSCTTAYNDFCTQCDEKNCLQCQGERIAPDCYCQFSLIPDINNNCNECQTDQFFNHTEFKNLIKNNLINLANYESQVCQSCKIHNLYCIECDANTCLNCQGERLAPDCFCMSDFVPDQNSNCKKCQPNQFFSEDIFQRIKFDNTININDYESQVCQPCQLFNQFCTQCDENQCLQCEGERIAPGCFCQIGQVPNQTDNTICEQCPVYHQFNHTEFEQIQISHTLSQFQSYLNDVCINCQIEYNQFCTKCDEERCLQCEGDRIAPDCLCQTGKVPSIFNNEICQNCQNTYFFNFTKYSEKLIDQSLDLQNYEAQVCFKCTDIYNQFCLQCDEQTCLECDGDRVSPECYCQNKLVPNQQDPLICEQCPTDQFFDSSIFQQIFANQTNIESYKSLVCSSDCSFHNQYCTLCDEEFCNECAGNRVLPDCFCSPGQVADQADFNNCKFCNQNQYYSEDQFQLQNCVQNYTCSEIELCIDCDQVYNQLCSKCNENICNECIGNNRQIPNCLCLPQYVPDESDPNNCVMCSSNTYYNRTAITGCSLDDQLNQVIGCQKSDFCVQVNSLHFCDSINIYYNTVLDEFQCYKCQGNRVLPYCQCQNQLMPVLGNEQFCQQCGQNQYYAKSLDDCKNKTDIYYEYDCLAEDACVECKEAHNKYCSQCNTDFCLVCEGNRVPPFCKCPDQMVSIQNSEICQYCYYDTYYNEPADLCTKQEDDGLYDCFFTELCVNCQIYNKFCILCDSNECLECQGNRVPPFCKCPEQWVTPNQYENQGSVSCVQCSNLEYYNEIKDECRANLQIDEDNQSQIQKYMSNLECYQDNVCDKCTDLHQFCSTCEKNQKQMSLYCQFCQGDLITTNIGVVSINGENLNVTTCRCPQNYYTFNNNTSKCIICMQNAVCEGSDRIIVKSGFWRISNYSSDIFECKNNPDSCLGGADNFTCAQGYTGALCESCDYLGDFWGDEYGKQSDFICEKCQKHWMYLKVGIYIFAISALTIFISFQGIKEVQNGIIQDALQRMFQESRKINITSDQLTIYIKIFLQYFSSITIITQLDIIDMSFISKLTENAGNPSKMIGFNADCFLKDFGEDIPIQTFRILYILFQFILYLVVSGLFFIFFKKKLFKTHQKIKYHPFQNDSENQGQYIDSEKYDPSLPLQMIFIKNFIFIFIDMQPSLINLIMNSITCKQVGNFSYQKSNTQELCNSGVQFFWTYFFSVPLLLICGFMLPFIMSQILKSAHRKNKFGKSLQQTGNLQIQPIFQNQNTKFQKQDRRMFSYIQELGKTKLDKTEMKYKYGFLYLEYQNAAYYWEILKIIQKVLINIMLSFFSEYVYVKALCGFFILFIYEQLVNKIQPFKNMIHNKLEGQSARVAYISLILCLLIYYNDFRIISIISYSIIVVINLVFIYKLVKSGGYNYFIELKFRLLKVLSVFKIFKKQFIEKQGSKQKVIKNWETIRRTIQKLIYLQKVKKKNSAFTKTSNKDYMIFSIRQIYPEIEYELDQYLKKQQQINKKQYAEFQKTVRKLFENKNEKIFNKTINTEANLKSLQQNSNQIANSDISLIKNQQHISLQDSNIVFNNSFKNSFYQHKKNQNMTDEQFLEQSLKCSYRSKSRKSENNEYQNQIRIIKQNCIKDDKINGNILQQINYTQFQQENDQTQVNQPNNSVIMEDSLISYIEKEELQKEQCKQFQKDDQQQELQEEQKKYQTQQKLETNIKLQNFIQKNQINSDKKKKIGTFQQDYQQQKVNIQIISKQMNDQQDIIT